MTSVQARARRRIDGVWPTLDLARDVNICNAISKSMRAMPDKTALVFGDQRVTYSELDAAIRRVGGQLRAAGIGEGEFVVTIGRSSAHLLVLYLALAHIGAVNVPLNPWLTTPEVLALIERTSPAVVIHTSEYVEISAAAKDSGYDVLTMPETPAELTTEGWFNPFSGPVPDDPPAPGGSRPAMVVFTSGSTALPKGCIKSHENLLWHVANGRVKWPRTADDVEYFCVPMSGVGVGNFLLPTLDAGATLVIDRPSAESGAIVERERVSTTLLPPSVAEAILLSEDGKARDFSRLRIVWTSFRITHEVRTAFVERVGPIFRYGFGMTEGSFVAAPADVFISKPTSAGPPDGVDEIVIGDPETGAPLPVGESGEILIKGPSVMLGYLDDPDTTAETLRGGWLHTGDLGHIDEDGHMHFDGRIKDTIKTGGLNVSAEEVEGVITTLVGVKDVAVIGVPDDHWGEAVRAVVVLDAGSSWTEESMILELRKTMAGYKTPKSVVFASELPRNPGLGKLAKGEIAKMYGS